MRAVILAAGNGERLWPLTEKKSKPMLEICGKPLIGHVLENVKEAGIEEEVVVARKEDERLIEYCSASPLVSQVVFQNERRGTGAALLSARPFVKGDFVVLAGDILFDAEILKRVIREHEGDITLAVKKVDDPSRYGVVELAGERVSVFEEKPQHPKSDLANLSIYCMNESVFDELEKIGVSERGEYEIVDILIGAKAVVVEGMWKDIGYPWDLLDGARLLLSRLPSKLGDVVQSTIKGKVYMEEGAQIIHSYVEGDVFIGKNTVIGPNAYIRGPTSIGRNCAIGVGSTVKSSVLQNNVKAKHLTYVGDSVVGDNVNFGAGTQIANFRFDEKEVKILTRKGWKNTGRKKFGAAIGDNTKFGILSGVMPGKLIGSDCWIYSGVIVNKNVHSQRKVYSRISLEESALEEGRQG